MKLRRRLLLPLVPAYAAALRGEQALATSGRLQRHTLDGVVLSIGSLSAGGAGKTPVVLALATMLRDRRYAVQILTRGYRRAGKGVERVDPAGSAAHFGDEPLLLAQQSGSPVYVGADRYRAGLLAEQAEEQGFLVHLLDDGFQHRRLARDLDLVLLTQTDVEDTLLPAGNLREPLDTLQRADVVILREDEAPTLRAFVSAATRETGEAAVWQIRRTLELPSSLEDAAPARPLAFCGIARPENFFAMLASNLLMPLETLTFPDHHRYTSRDISRLLAAARGAGATSFVTTEKDAVKLTLAMRARLETVGPLLAPRLRITFLEERSVMEQLIALVPRLDRRRRER